VGIINTGGIPCIIRNRSNGLMMEPDRPEELVAALQAVLRDWDVVRLRATAEVQAS
jgi:hypothetical protein